MKLKCLIFSIILIVLGVNIGIKFYNYKTFISKYQFIEGKVVSQYYKKNYWVLKVKSKNLEFYTTTKDDLKDILNKNVEVGIVSKNITFWEYLTKFYAPTFKLGVLETPQYEKFINYQHKDKYISNLFNALFFGDGLYYEIRQKLSTLGISHLFALSGLHLAIISGVLYLIFTPIYNLLFPSYRNRNVDLGILILIVLFSYLWFVNFPPSLVRSFVMELVIFLFAYFLRDIFSFKLLFVAVVMSLVIFPNFIVSLGFFLSVMGVFLIFLFFKYFKPTFFNGLILLPFYLYFSMLPISHYFFGNFNLYQLLSPFVSIIFSFFYPLEIFLHLIGEGNLLDEVIKSYFNLGDKFITFYTPSWLFYGYLIILLYLSNKPSHNQNHYKPLK